MGCDNDIYFPNPESEQSDILTRHFYNIRNYVHQLNDGDVPQYSKRMKRIRRQFSSIAKATFDLCSRQLGYDEIDCLVVPCSGTSFMEVLAFEPSQIFSIDDDDIFSGDRNFTAETKSRIKSYLHGKLNTGFHYVGENPGISAFLAELALAGVEPSSFSIIQQSKVKEDIYIGHNAEIINGEVVFTPQYAPTGTYTHFKYTHNGKTVDHHHFSGIKLNPSSSFTSGEVEVHQIISEAAQGRIGILAKAAMGVGPAPVLDVVTEGVVITDNASRYPFFVYSLERKKRDLTDREFLKAIGQKRLGSSRFSIPYGYAEEPRDIQVWHLY